MNTPRELDDAIDRYVAFLSGSQAPGADHWSLRLREARQQLGHTPTELAARLLSFYGGMGSINDVVTQAGEETDLYHTLNERLYQVCQTALGRHGAASP